MTVSKMAIAIAEHYGLGNQLSQLQEECAELIQASSKFMRSDIGKNPEVAKNIIEEIADVQLMLTQVKYLMKIPESSINDVMESKCIRQLKRIKEESQCSTK